MALKPAVARVADLTERRSNERDESSEQHLRALRLQRVTIAWNSGEVFITIALGVAAGSLALVAFGLDSLIEVFTSLVVLWHMSDSDPSDNPMRNRRANRLVAAAFAALSLYLLISSTRSLLGHRVPENSLWGVAYLAATAVVMLWLAHMKRRSGRQIHNEIFLAEARMTQLDAYLALSIMTALTANLWFGWWWADAVSAAGIGLLAAAESRERYEASKAGGHAL